MKKGNIPLSEKIVLESNSDQWILLKKGLVSKVESSGIIQVSKEKKIRINLTIVKIIIPGEVIEEVDCLVEAKFLNSDSVKGLIEVTKFLFDFLSKSCWTFFGYINNGDNNIPIIIRYYESFDFAVYAIKTKEQKIENFFPAGVPKDPTWN